MNRLLAFLAAGILYLSPAGVLGAELPEGTPEHPFKIKIAASTRVDFDYENFSASPHQTGFHGRYLNLMLDGAINKHLDFHWRQRMNKFGDMKSDVFGATDWVYLNYSPNSHWTFSGGKQIVAIGGFEYDRNPINIYYASMFWNSIACFQMGVSATYHTADGRHNILFQFCNSTLQPMGSGCFAYNLMWQGRMGLWSTIWSANLIEYAPGKYGNYIVLGNRFDFSPHFYTEIDLANRYMGAGHFLFDDYSVIGKVCGSIWRFDIFAKGGYEHFRPIPGAAGTIDKPYYGGGIEFFPLKNSRDLRLHLVADVTHDGATGERRTQLTTGLMWHVNLFSRGY